MIKAEAITPEIVSMLEALKSSGQTGFWTLLVCLLIILALVIAAVVYQQIVIRRFQISSKATQEHLKAIELVLKQREVGVKEREELRETFTKQFSLVKDTNAELRTELQRLQEQQQLLNKEQQALNESVNRAITLGLEDIRKRLLQTSFNEMMSQIPDSLKADLQKVLEQATDDAVSKIQNRIETWLALKALGETGP